MGDLVWRVPAISVCVWLGIAPCAVMEASQSLWVQIPLVVSTLWWGALAGFLVKVGVRVISTTTTTTKDGR